MSACEKCWVDSDGNPDRYSALLKEQKCTPEEQAGLDAMWCLRCERKTAHQWTGKCMNPECRYDSNEHKS